MKLIKTATFLFCITLAFTSCKKEFTCACTVTVDVPLFGSVSTSENTTIKDTKKKAKSACKSAESALQAEVGADGTASCQLK